MEMEIEPQQSQSQLAPPLRHTLQVWQGMVLNNGQPFQRDVTNVEQMQDREKEYFPDDFMNLMYEEHRLNKAMDFETKHRPGKTTLLNILEAFVRQNKIPLFKKPLGHPMGFDNFVDRIQSNVAACTRKDITMKMMKEICKKRKRIDIEQATGLIVSFLGPEFGSQLIPYLSEIIFGACMTITDCELQRQGRKSYDDFLEEKWERFLEKVGRIITGKHEILVPTDPKELLKVLERIRRKRPNDLSRTLRIPISVYQYLGLAPPKLSEQELMADHWGQVCWTNGAPSPENVIILSLHHFSIIERLLQRYQEKSDQSSILRREIDRLEKEIMFGVTPRRSHYVIEPDPISLTNDPLALAFSFIALQRRLQLKVVSDMGWTSFLKQGEGKQIWQNDWATLTSFELKLFEMATSPTRNQAEIDWKCLSIITTPVEGQSEHQRNNGIGQELRTLSTNEALLTRCCLLMEAYVKVYGSGQIEKLRYIRGIRADPRGPVDQYNNLCTILQTLRDRISKDDAAPTETRENLPGPCHKFLAKDIMQWNDAFKDDAFADGKIPGWFTWLEKRRREGYDCPPLM